jgi:NADH:ubiquinone oxidoreductase subunit F (NADH-binding)
VIVNGAEGEPSTFKDRAILRANPYQVLEGALIAARVMAANEVVVALKRSFRREVERVRAAIEELRDAGWCDGIEMRVFEGPDEYLYGEETALLEALDGRWPFPRIAPPWRRGEREVFESEADRDSESGLSAHVLMAGSAPELVAPPALVENVETLANIPRIVDEGEAWFRMEGTQDSPGTVVCTVTGSTVRSGVGEVAMGTPLRDVIDAIGGGPRPGRRIRAVLPGVSSAFVTEADLDVPVSFEGFAGIGSGLGSAGFFVCDDGDDLVAVTAGASRFLAVESCGQCTPCKQDGLRLSELLADLCRQRGDATTIDLLRTRAETVTEGARCALATEHQTVVRALLDRFDDDVHAHLRGTVAPTEPREVSELLDIEAGVATIDGMQKRKQPDWSYDERWSGAAPADLHADHRLHEHPPTG